MAQSQTPFIFLLLMISLIINSAFVQCNYFTKSSAVSLSLHPYSSIMKQHSHNYTALTLSRLASDLARLNSIHSKLQQALHNNNSGHPTDNLRTSLSPGGGSYLVRIGVGRPEKEFYMTVDTGSGLTWLQCQPCSRCFKQYGPIFNPSTSSSFAPLPCSSWQCASLPSEIKQCYHNKQCGYRLNYGDESYSSGTLATETLTFNRNGLVEDVAIGCGFHSGGHAGFGGAAGLMGLGGGLESLPSQINASSFSYCLVDIDSKSSSTLEFNTGPPKYYFTVPMDSNPKIKTGFFYVKLFGILVPDVLPLQPSIFKIQKDGSGGVILDSGSSVTLLPAEAYDALKVGLSDYTTGLPRTNGFSFLDTCYHITSANPYERFPLIGFAFSYYFIHNSEKTLWVEPANYLRPVDSNGTFCLFFAKSWLGVSIIGTTQQKGTRISYDLANKQIAFGLDSEEC